jgi:hypothetical protein
MSCIRVSWLPFIRFFIAVDANYSRAALSITSRAACARFIDVLGLFPQKKGHLTGTKTAAGEALTISVPEPS